jgi:hypothetical protein
MKQSQSFMALLSVTVVMGSLLSGTGAAQGCLYQQYESSLPGFTEPLSGSDSLTQASFLESREMTMASAAVIAGLLGLSLLFRQSKGEEKAAQEKPAEAPKDKGNKEKEKKHPEAPGGQLDVKQENKEKAADKEEKTSAPALEKEEKKEVAAAK